MKEKSETPYINRITDILINSYSQSSFSNLENCKSVFVNN